MEASTTKKSTIKDTKVDDRIKNGVHSAVNDLMEDEKTWDFSKGFKEGRNSTHTREVLVALGNKIGSFDRDMAYKGCRTYFHTLKTKSRKTKENTIEKSRKQQRKRQRKSSARVRRRAILNVSTAIADVDKENLFTVLENNDYMSSEESEEVSCSDSDDDSGKIQFVKRKLMWRSDYLNNWFLQLDKKSARKKQSSKKGGAALRPRAATKGISDREEPSSPPSFAIQPFEEPDSS
ncbi:uncharacterized protein [Mytilus edulis]|uniref:uncharacterized protein n=1 Tax=Mytilus edulis TaxID=6550 RepID=UPI0039EFDF54